jgi:diguanylate cyclase (GGDEF)-like protein
MTARKFFLLYSFLLMSVLVGSLLSYRALITIPELEKNVLAYQQREMSAVFHALDNKFEVLKTLNYDYAIWNNSYEFMTGLSEDFINENLITDTFISLKIDGVYYVNVQGEVAWGMGFDWVTEETLEFKNLSEVFPILWQRFLNEKLLLTNDNVPQASGFLPTNEGLVMYTATMLRHSDKSGPEIGFLMFVRKLRPRVIDKISQLAGVKIKNTAVISLDSQDRKNILSQPTVNAIQKSRAYFLPGINDEPLLNLDIQHSLSADLKLIDNQTLSIIALLALLPISLQILVYVSFVKPLTHSIDTVGKNLSNGDLKMLKSSALITEVKTLNEEFNHLINTITEQKNMMEKLSLLDGLTNIANRRSFEKAFSTSWQAMLRNKTPLAVLMCDIDFFKPYNDNYGHQAGDKALIEVAQALHNRIARPHESVSRYGGEEFIIILPLTNSQQCQKVIDSVQNLIAALKIKHEYSQVSDVLTISIGASVIDNVDSFLTTCNEDDFFKTADTALYQAKNEGRNRSVIHAFSDPQNSCNKFDV